MRGKTALALIIVTFVATTSARAQEAAPEASPQEASPEAGPTPAADGGRFRFGINGTLGSESAAGVSGLMYGFDLRLGWQFNQLLAIYVQPHLSFGSLSADAGAAGSVSGFTGTFLVTVLGEATFLDRFFAGAGFGYGVLNNPSGFAIDLKAGGYPLMTRGTDGIRRKGLMLGLDFRTVFLEGATGLLVMGCIGYESF